MSVQLSIIIVNYKTPQLVIDCLQSIAPEEWRARYEVIIVDNASGDNSQQLITNAFPQIKWIQMSYNAGFARANNEGLRVAQADAMLLLNSDTIVLDNAISKCLDKFQKDEYLAAGVQLLNRDGTAQISGNYFMKGALNNLLPLPYVGNVLKRLGYLAKVKKPNVPDSNHEIEVDWINGAYLMVKRQAIQQAGLMDEDFFLYAEESEWCSRIKNYGTLCIYGQFKVIHLQGESANQTFGSKGQGYYNLYDRKGLQIMLSNFVRIKKQYGTLWFFIHLLFYSFTIPVYFLFSFVENLFRRANPFFEFGRAGNFAGNVFSLWGFTGRILSGKPYFYKVL